MEDTLPTTAQDVFDAATLGDIDRLRDLLDLDPDLVKAHGTDGFTALHLASSFGRDKAAELLLARGADAQGIAANGSGDQLDDEFHGLCPLFVVVHWSATAKHARLPTRGR